VKLLGKFQHFVSQRIYLKFGTLFSADSLHAAAGSLGLSYRDVTYALTGWSARHLFSVLD